MELNKNVNKEGRLLLSALSYQENTVLPEFKEQANLSFVKYGADNQFPRELLNLFEKSSIHNAIIETKVRMMTGDGIVQDVPDEEFSDKTQEFLDHPNPFETMDQIYTRCAMDFELYGLAYLEVIWGKGRTKIAEIHHIDASKIRWGKYDNKNQIMKYYYSRDWHNYRKENYAPIELPIFDSKGSAPRQIIPIIRYTPGLDYYAFPDYIAATKWIQIDTEIANFHFNNLQNGMSPSVFFGFPVGDTTNEERKTIEEKIKKKYVGTNQAGKFIIAFYDAEGDSKPEVKILEQTNADKQYELLNKTTLQQILVGHKVTNENLVGISTPGKLGSSSEVLENYELYYNTVIKTEQTTVLEPFQKLMLINGMTPIKIVQNKPLDISFSENILKDLLTQDEMRDMIGFEPIEVEENVINEDDIIEDESGITVENERYDYDFAGVRRIDKNNAKTVIKNANLQDTYIWNMSKSDDNCPSCQRLNGTTRTLERWLKIAIPGQIDGTNFGIGTYVSPYGGGKFGTYCEDACNCTLRKVGRTTKK